MAEEKKVNGGEACTYQANDRKQEQLSLQECGEESILLREQFVGNANCYVII
jgi:hypothetical protein